MIAFDKSRGHFVDAISEITQFVIGNHLDFLIEISVTHFGDNTPHLLNGKQNGSSGQKIEDKGDRYKKTKNGKRKGKYQFAKLPGGNSIILNFPDSKPNGSDKQDHRRIGANAK